jgi:uncharacterized protein YsxB (DUF464 family)
MYTVLLLASAYALPSINKVYSVALVFPLLGNQNIEFERLKKNTSQVRLSGLINCKGYIYNDIADLQDTNYEKKTYMNYELDNSLKNIMNKYRCSIEAPYYDANNDIILFVLKINMLGLTKSVKLLSVG